MAHLPRQSLIIAAVICAGTGAAAAQRFENERHFGRWYTATMRDTATNERWPAAVIEDPQQRLASMRFECKGGRLTVFVQLAYMHGILPDKAQAVSVRFNKEPPVLQLWTGGDERRLHPEAGAEAALAKRVMEASEVALRAPRHGAPPEQDAVFDTRRAAEALSAVASACKL